MSDELVKVVQVAARVYEQAGKRAALLVKVAREVIEVTLAREKGAEEMEPNELLDAVVARLQGMPQTDDVRELVAFIEAEREREEKADTTLGSD